MHLRAIALVLALPLSAACGTSDASPAPAATPVTTTTPAVPAPTPGPSTAAVIHCDLAAFLGSCEEHPTSNTELKDTCEGIGGTFGSGPCPTAGRVGHCECATPECTAAGVHPMYLYAPTIDSDTLGQTMCGQLRFVRDSP